jgi:UDP-3-O-[3-hydroxymyristoyl] glucosamine N-acyltransferase
MFYFEKKNQSIKLKDLLTLTGAMMENNDFLEKEIFGINTLAKSAENEISFYSNFKYAQDLANTKAFACFIKENDATKLPKNVIPLLHKDPYFAFAVILNYFYGSNEFTQKQAGTHPSAIISKTAKIGANASIGANVVISEDVNIAEDVTIMPNTFIGEKVSLGKGTIVHDNCSIMFATIGENCIIRSGARIGISGFGFAPNLKTGKHLYIPQIAGVKIGNFVDIGANTAIDRGCLEDTEIMDNAKLDNLIQVAHGVKIGSSTFVAGQTGFAGSSKIGNFCFVGAQVGVAGHLEVADFTQVGGKSGIIKSITEKGQTVAGFPAIPKIKWDRMQIKLKNLIFKEK